MEVMKVWPRTDAEEQSLDRSIVEVCARLQSAYRSLIRATPGDKRRPVDLARTLSVSTKLAWQVYRVAHATDPLKEVANAPRRAAQERFLAAAARRGAPEARVSEVREAAHELNQLVKRHAGSRTEFETMISSITEGGTEQVDLIQKRAAFKAQAHILGVQARVHLSCSIYRRSASFPDRLDLVGIRGHIGMRRFRKEARWIVSQTRVVTFDGTTRRPVASESLDPTVDSAHGLSLLPAFCSQPLPTIRRVPSRMEHMTNIEICGDGIGNASSATCLVGDIFRGACPVYRDEQSRKNASVVRVRMPCEMLIHDVLIHRPTIPFDKPTVSVFSDLRDVDNDLESRECDRLSIQESVLYLGKGLEVIASPEIPRYAEMIEYAMNRFGWDPTEFDVYRCEIAYPVVPSSAVVHFDLPSRLGQST